MNPKLVLFGLLVSGIAILYSLNIYQLPIGPHGGELKQAEDFNIELKASFPNLYVYLLDQKFKPINNKDISCEIRFFFPGDVSNDIVLKPFQEDGFVIETSKIMYKACRVTFNISGKSVSALFEKESSLVQRKGDQE